MKRKGFKGILLLLSMLFALTGCSVSEATQHGMAVDTIQAEDVLLRVDFLNVGQADCALLSTNGHYMVIDGGNNGDADTILSYLEGQGVEKLDAVVGTHPHEDHIGSLDAIINHFDVDAVYMPKIMHTSKTFENVLDAVANKGLKIKSPDPGDTIDFNGLEIEVLGPQREYKDFNNNSIVLKVNAGETAFLFTGDAEETAGQWSRGRENGTSPVSRFWQEDFLRLVSTDLNGLYLVGQKEAAWEHFSDWLYGESGLPVCFTNRIPETDGRKTVLVELRANARILKEHPEFGSLYVDLTSDVEKRRQIREKRADISYISARNYLDTALKARYNAI